jgi:hypothetical protein
LALSDGNCSVTVTPHGPVICANDVLVIIDAYDVALTIAARLLGRLLFKSPTPIIFCGEIAAYPNYAYAYVYPSQRGFPNRFLNGGCYMGPVEYVTSAMESLIAENSIFRTSGEQEVVLADDQYEWARFYLERPYYVHIESAQKHMICVFRTGLSVAMHWTGTLTIIKVGGEGLHKSLYPSIVHFNADIKFKYEMLVSNYFMPLIRRIISEFSGPDIICLRKLWAFWDQLYLEATDENISLYDGSGFSDFCGQPPNFYSVLCKELYNCFKNVLF